MRILILTPLMLLVACGSNDGKTITVKDGDSKITLNSKSDGDVTTIRTTGGDGENVTATVNVNGATWPSTVEPYAVAYPGAKVVSVISSDGGSHGGGTAVSFESSDSPEKIVGFYKALATRAGLKESMTMNSGDTSVFAAGKDGNGSGFMVQATASGGTTTASVTVSKEG